MRKTKIICTLGPSCNDTPALLKLIQNGMDVARINMSHADYREHEARINNFKEARRLSDTPVALLLDTKGPEIRTGDFINGTAELAEGSEFTLCAEDILGDFSRCSINYKELYRFVQKGTIILLDDGLVALEVLRVQGRDIITSVQNSGTVKDKRKINVPGTDTDLPSMTQKDKEDLLFGIKNGVDLIAASFIRKAADISEIRRLLEQNGAPDIRIIAKIETRQAVENIDEIIKTADGIMVARGDLGVEIPIERVPLIQKQIVQNCYLSGKPVIVATQMLESMIHNPRPTRAEANDIATAIYDGTSAIMLSGETAMGKYPQESLMTMARIAETAENSIDYWQRFSTMRFDLHNNITNAIGHATCTTAMDLKAAAVITFTKSGNTARMISRFRPACPIIATTTSEAAQRQLMLSWGVFPLLVREVRTTDEMFETGVNTAFEHGMVSQGDLVVITAGVPVAMSGTTNILKVHMVGNVLVQGTGIGTRQVTGELCVAKDPLAAQEQFTAGCILTVPFTNNDLLPLIKHASAVIVEEQGANSHAAITGMALDKTMIIGAENATRILKSGAVVTVDPIKGLVLCNEGKCTI